MSNVKITALEIENVKRVRAVSVDTTSPLTVIGGRNSMGKTSVLDAIMWTLGGDKFRPSNPVRKGEEQAYTKVTLDNGVIAQFVSRQDARDYVANNQRTDLTIADRHSADSTVYKPSADFRWAVVEKLALFENADSVEPLLFALKDASAEVRSAAARVYGVVAAANAE